MSGFIFNTKETLVRDAIEGALYLSKHQNLTLLDFNSPIKVVARRDWQKDKVAVICGGGSGHEPAHVGFVGKGMLTAAVCGELFAAPSVDAVFNTILHVTGEAGCLVIIKNYTGDRLNFGLAVEKAKKLGLAVDLMIVGDDISLPDNPQPRGIAGTILVQKVAGYVAEQGGSLQAVKQAALDASEHTASIGAAITGCTLPSPHPERIAQGKVEIGLGIHGEAGVETIDLPQAKVLVARMLSQLAQAKPMQQHALLVNNLGGLSYLEMNLVVKAIMDSEHTKAAKFLIGGVQMMTAIDMKGFSISKIALDDEIEKALLAPVEVQAWPEVIARCELPRTPCTLQTSALSYQASHDQSVESILRQICQAILEHHDALNDLDAVVGDGDTGSTFAAGARGILAKLDAKALPLQDTASLLQVIADELRSVMGGSSGVLLSILLTAAGREYAQSSSLVAALQEGAAQMMKYGGAQLGDRTLLDALLPALDAWSKHDFNAGVVAAKEGAEATASMQTAKAGRASYLNAKQLEGTKDPGAFAVEVVFAGLGAHAARH